MTEHDDNDKDKDDTSARTDLREGLGHLFSAFRKIAKSAEPAMHKSLDSAEQAVQAMGKGGESLARDMGREVAAAATRLAERLRTLAEREDNPAGDASRPEGGESATPDEPLPRHDEPKSE